MLPACFVEYCTMSQDYRMRTARVEVGHNMTAVWGREADLLHC
jgi:hypothetical protein